MNENVWNESLEFGALHLQYYSIANSLNIVSLWHISQIISKGFIISHTSEEVVKAEDEVEYIDVKEEIYRNPQVQKSAGIFFVLVDYM